MLGKNYYDSAFQLTDCTEHCWLFSCEHGESVVFNDVRITSRLRSEIILFLPHDSRSAKRGIAIVSRPSVRLTVCLSDHPSVTLRYREHRGWTSSQIVTRVISYGVFAPRSHNIGKSKGNTSKFGWNRGRVALLSRKPAISLKRGKIWPRLLLITNRKSHTHFRLVPKSTTLDDLEGPLCNLFQNTFVFGAHHENLNEDRHILYQRRRCSPVTLISSNITFMRIFTGVPWRGTSNDSWVIENVDF